MNESSTSTQNPFSDMEALLADPPTDGACATHVDANSPLFASGLRVDSRLP